MLKINSGRSRDLTPKEFVKKHARIDSDQEIYRASCRGSERGDARRNYRALRAWRAGLDSQGIGPATSGGS